MNFLTILFAAFLTFSNPTWLTDFSKAQIEAKAAHKFILVNFSGSDWCGPCIKMKREIFESAEFNAYATEHLVLVNADFPRQKKNKLPAEQVKLNEVLADKYNKEGLFPLTLLLDENGNVLKKWSGNPGLNTQQFIAQFPVSGK